jgi:DNA-binding response OmpR family regulator
VLVAQLRKKIDRAEGASYIETEPWIGYRFRSSPVLSGMGDLTIS